MIQDCLKEMFYYINSWTDDFRDFFQPEQFNDSVLPPLKKTITLLLLLHYFCTHSQKYSIYFNTSRCKKLEFSWILRRK